MRLSVSGFREAEAYIEVSEKQSLDDHSSLEGQLSIAAR
jgi:hypothetical protein